jgi:N6-adenosine-specific RNA methylase IME4
MALWKAASPEAEDLALEAHETPENELLLLEPHPLANLFPLLEGPDFDELVDDIRGNGLIEPIVVLEDRILDGRNRYRACLAAGVEPTFRPFLGDDPLAYVVSLNLKRRHLSESQRAMVAAKLATLPHGANQWRTGQLAAPPTQEEAAALLNIGERSVRRAAEVRDHGVPELRHAVEQGTISVTAAADIATQPLDEQREIVARGKQEILRKAQEIRAGRTEERRAERIARAIELSACIAPLPTNRKYPLILADFSMTSPRAIEAHYPTMALEEICALPVPQLAAPIAVLFLWVPPAILEKAFAVIRAWDFSYATGAVWMKDRFGAGFYFRQQHEHLLLATRGDMPAPPPHARRSSIIEAPRGAHSEKPATVYELIEGMYPDLPKIELFARHGRPGWDSWGNEAPDPQLARGGAA